MSDGLEGVVAAETVLSDVDGAAGRLVISLLYGVRPNDPAQLAAAALILAAAAALAGYLPARRAARLDPMITLREE